MLVDDPNELFARVGVVADEDDLAEVRVTARCPRGRTGTVTVAVFIQPTVGTLWKDQARATFRGERFMDRRMTVAWGI